MNELITQSQFDYIVECAFQHPLHFLWYCTDVDTSADYKKLPPEIATFQYRRDVFLFVLEHLLRSGRLKLARNGELFEGSPEKLVDMFRKAWPESALAADKVSFLPNSKDIGSGEGMGLWFLMAACPATAVWVLEDGTLDWA